MNELAREAPLRHCEERSDEAIQRARSAPNKKRGSRGNLSALFGAPAGARLDCFASLAMTLKFRAHACFRFGTTRFNPPVLPATCCGFSKRSRSYKRRDRALSLASLSRDVISGGMLNGLPIPQRLPSLCAAPGPKSRRARWSRRSVAACRPSLLRANRRG